MAETRAGPALRGILAAIAVLAIALPAVIVRNAPPSIPARALRAQRHIVPAAMLPPVDPVKLVDLPPADARLFNASVPFVDGPNPAARPFRLPGDSEDLGRAIDCLAAAVLYEAGDDQVGEKAVAQVVLNRVRHPAFPKTICGVVFQGSERSTGCQFTFTCDGALARHPSDAGWKRAREIARAALTGSVYKPVGYATHYHTDWVVPYWQSSLDKIAAVHTHLFFRWTGWWGTPAAFRRSVEAGEPVIARLVALSDAHRIGAGLTEAEAALADGAAITGPMPMPLVTSDDSFLVTLDRKLSPDSYAVLAAKACGARVYCKFLGWTDRSKTPAALPLEQAQIAAMAFSYLRDQSIGLERTLWNCQQNRRADPKQCMKVQVLTPVAPVPGFAPPPVVQTRAVPALTGVRRKTDAAAKPVTTPAPSPAEPVTPP